MLNYFCGMIIKYRLEKCKCCLRWVIIRKNIYLCTYCEKAWIVYIFKTTVKWKNPKN